MKTFFGMDIGGSSIKYGFGNSKHGLQFFNSRQITCANLAEFRELIKGILCEIDHVLGMENIIAIGIGAPGTLDIQSSKIIGVNPNLPFLTDVNPSLLLPDNLDKPVYCDNDANLMALAESTALRHSNALGITIGSGIGCGIILEGSIYHGSHGFAGELGHTIVVPNGYRCNCGNNGCVEAYSSVGGIYRRLTTQSSHYELLSLLEIINTASVDRTVSLYLKEAQDYLSISIANLVTCLDLDIAIIGGGAMEAKLYNTDQLEQSIKRMIPTALRDSFRCVKASHGNKAGVLGAIKLCERYCS